MGSEMCIRDRHPLAQAILEAAEEEGLDLLPVSYFEAIVGRGLSAQVEGNIFWSAMSL